MHSKAKLIVSVAAVAAFALSACGGSGGSSSSAGDGSGSDGGTAPVTASNPLGLSKDILDAARKEGQVTMMGTGLQSGTLKSMQQIIKQQYGITLNFIPGKVAEEETRLKTESQTGKHTIDVLGVGAEYGEVLTQQGLTQAFQPTGINAAIRKDVTYDKDGNWYPIELTLFGMLENTQKLPESQLTGWNSIVNGSISCPLIMADPSTGSGGYTWAVDMTQMPRYGTDYLKKLGQQKNLQLNATVADAEQQVFRGDACGYFPFGTYTLSDIPSSVADHVKLVFPGNEPYVGSINEVIVKGAPHPNASKVLAAFLLSKQGQKMLVAAGATPVRTDVPASAQYNLSKFPKTVPLHIGAILKYQGDIQGFVSTYFGSK